MAVLLKRWIREPLNTAAMYFRWSIIFRLASGASKVAGRVSWRLCCPLLGMLCARTNDAAWVCREMRTMGSRWQWPLRAQLESLMPSLRIFSHSVLRVMPSASALWVMCPP